MITEVQRAMRARTIGSSEAAAILGLSPYASAWDVWAEKSSMLKAGGTSEAAELGDAMEGHLVDWAARRLNMVGLARDVVLVHAVHPFLVANADAVGTEKSGERVGIEAKTGGLCGPLVGEWGEEWTDDVPDQYFIQCQFQMACGAFDSVYLPALLGGRGRVMYRIARNDHTIEMMMKDLLRFWSENILGGVAPAMAKPSEETISRIIRVPNKTIDIDSACVDRWAAAREDRLAAEKVEEDAKNKMLGELMDAEEGLLGDGRRLTYFETHRKGYQVAPCSYRSPRLKKGWKSS